MDEILLDRKAAAKLLSISSRHLISLEHTGMIPKPRRLGRRVLFDASELKEWAAAGCPSAERFSFMKKDS